MKTRRQWFNAYVRYLKASNPKPVDLSEEMNHIWATNKAKKDLA